MNCIAKKAVSGAMALAIVGTTGLGICGVESGGTVFSDTSISASAASSVSMSKVTISVPSSITINESTGKVTTSQFASVSTLKYGSKTLKYGTDYTVSFSNNAGGKTVTATIKGTGNYTGSVKKTFKAAKVKLSSAKITMDSSTLQLTPSGTTLIAQAFCCDANYKKVLTTSQMTKGSAYSFVFTPYSLSTTITSISKSNGKAKITYTAKSSDSVYTGSKTITLAYGTQGSMAVKVDKHSRGASSITAYVNGTKVTLKKSSMSSANGVSTLYAYTGSVKFTYNGKTYSKTLMYAEKASVSTVSASTITTKVNASSSDISFNRGVYNNSSTSGVLRSFYFS